MLANIYNNTQLELSKFGFKVLLLNSLYRKNLNVLPGVALSWEWLVNFLNSNDIKIESITSSEMLLEYLKLKNAKNTVIKHYGNEINNLNYESFAVRSSAIIDSNKAITVSGIYDTYLDVNKEFLIETIFKVYSSYFKKASINRNNYFEEKSKVKGLGVLIQPYFHPRVSGVVRSNSLIIPDHFQVDYVNGHLGNLMQGRAHGKTIYIPRYNGSNEFLCKEEDFYLLIDNGYENLLTELKQLVITLSNTYNYEFEIEWGYDGRNLVIFQLQNSV